MAPCSTRSQAGSIEWVHQEAWKREPIPRRTAANNNQTSGMTASRVATIMKTEAQPLFVVRLPDGRERSSLPTSGTPSECAGM